MPDQRLLDFFESQEKNKHQAPRVIIYLLIAFFCIVNPLLGALIDGIVWSFDKIVFGVILYSMGITFIAIITYVSILFIGLFLTEPLRLLQQKFQKSWIKALHNLLEVLLLFFFNKIGLSGIVLLLHVVLFILLIGVGVSEKNTGIQEFLQMAL